MSNNALRTLVGLSLVSALAISSHAQELTPDQRRFMGLPPSGPLRPQHSTVVAPQVESAPVLPTGQRASPGPAMTFRTVGTGGASCCEWIAADGVITIDTPQVFKEFLASLGKNGPTLQESITFNSPGGDFFAALALGREIRRSTRMWTAVGRTEAEAADQAGGPQTYRASGGVCLSSCVLAFMGGKTRDYHRGAGATQQTLAFESFALDQPASVLGRMSADAMDGGGLPAPGLLRLAMEGYATEMGVSPSIVALMETASQPGGVHVLSQDEADERGMNTPAGARTKWTLSAKRGGLALYGSGEDRWTRYTVGFQCISGERGALEYSIAVPAEGGDQPLPTVEDGYRQGIQGANVKAGGTSTAARVASVQLLAGKLLVTTWLAAPQVATIEHGEATIAFEVPHSLENVLPDISLASPQVTGAVDLLLRNCPNS
jgi:hypothetical protein